MLVAGRHGRLTRDQRAPHPERSPDNDIDRDSDRADADRPGAGPIPVTGRPPGTTRCPVCRRCYTPVGRQLYCSTACRKTAFRRRHQQLGPAVTVYECPDCGDRYLGEQRCQGCGTFARRVGIGGACPNCEGPVAISDPLDEAVVTITKK